MNTIQLPELREEKCRVLDRINQYLNTNKKGYIKVPTGWGKTFLAKHLMKQYYEDGKAILFLVSSNNQLLNQTFYSDSGSKKEPLFPNSFALVSGHNKISAEYLSVKIDARNSGIVIFASLQTILSENQAAIKKILQTSMDLVVIDEIHNFIHNRGNLFIEEIDTNVSILGMTATPFQGVVGNVKFVDEISGDMNEIFSKTLPECILDGQLSELDYSIVLSHQSVLKLYDFSNGIKALEKSELILDCSTEEHVQRVIQRTHLAKRVYSDTGMDNGSKTLIFCAPVRNIGYGIKGGEKAVRAFHAKLSAAIFNDEIKNKIDQDFAFSNYDLHGQLKSAACLSSDIPKNEQEKIVKAFKTLGEKPFVLCSVGTLIEGFDFPELHNLILLRPTLSMRLYEQQIGRVTREGNKDIVPQKERGNIIEIADDIDSMYDEFGDKVFNEKNIDKIQMLRPENRIEEVFTEGGNVEAISTGRINISEIDFREDTSGLLKHSVQIPPISMKAKYFYRLLETINKETMGKLSRKRRAILKAVLGFKVTDKESAREVSKILESLNELEKEARADDRLTPNCREHKPKLFNEVKWFLRLVALTCIRLSELLEIDDKNSIMTMIGFEGDSMKIDSFREQCVINGWNSEGLDDLRDAVLGYGRYLDLWQSIRGPQGATKEKQRFWAAIFWASQFTIDRPEFRELFESKEWTYNVKHYIVK